VGKYKGLSKEKQIYLKEIGVVVDDENPYYDVPVKGNKFLQHQEEERIRKEAGREDKHVLPIEVFYDQEENKLENIDLPYIQIDLIFNHKNVWANL